MKKNLLKILLVILTTNLVSINLFAGSSCDCWQIRDNTWTVAAFDGSGGAGGPGTPPLYRNDDWSTDTITLPFNFCFYGDTVTKIFINNNGNVSIGAPYATYTATGFPDTSFAMVAPFWADHDTRDSLLSGVVYYKINTHEIIIQWDHVGYYNTHADKVNTYQLIISDGNSSLLPEDKNVGFCYQDMQWTTGDFDGTNGFGGTPATVGVNYGDGTNYLQIGRYDTNTVAYDGPFGVNDGVSSLDFQSFAFDVCVNNFNVAPILAGEFVCDTGIICVGDTFVYSASFLSPEQSELTTVTVDDHGAAGISVNTTPGNPASVTMTFISQTPGFYTVDISGTDNGTPAQNTTYTLYFDVQNCATGINESMASRDNVSPNPCRDNLYLDLLDANNYIVITDLSGRVVYRNTAPAVSTLNTSEWEKGIYFVNVKSPIRTKTFKIIKD